MMDSGVDVSGTERGGAEIRVVADGRGGKGRPPRLTGGAVFAVVPIVVLVVPVELDDLVGSRSPKAAALAILSDFRLPHKRPSAAIHGLAANPAASADDRVEAQLAP